LLFRQVLARAPDHLPATEGMFELERLRSNYAKAAALRERVVELRGKATAADLKQLAEMNMRAGNSALAEKHFRALLEVEPYSYSGHRNLGEMLATRKDWQGALPHLEHVVRFNPDYEVKVYKMLAEVYENLGRARDARWILLKGRRIFPSDTSLAE
jgi:tetratricopeptide (TPR) repeat protein